MRFARFSVADLLVTIGLCALSLACLIYASTPWATAVLSVALASLVLALIGVIYRRGERRAFWAGFAICGWTYLILSCSPWFIPFPRSQLVTSKLLEWAYPILIPKARQSLNPDYTPRPFVVPPATLEDGLTIEDLSGARVDVWVKADDEKAPTLLAEDVPTMGMGQGSASGASIAKPALIVDRDQFAKLSRAKAYSQKFTLRRALPKPFAPLWSSPPVGPTDFANVGHALFVIVSAWTGSMAGRYFFATRERTP
jgi:hypothetical protein